MTRRIRYLTHPQIVIDPDRDVRLWGLSETGRARVERLAKSRVLAGTRTIVSSAETKARQTAAPLAAALGCGVIVRENMHENDRSATGFLPSEAFEQVADRFFADPDGSVRGWETARDAQTRIVAEVAAVLAQNPDGDLLFVGHGAVGTLLYCHHACVSISRDHDQIVGGGCFFDFTEGQAPEAGWRPLESLLD